MKRTVRRTSRLLEYPALIPFGLLIVIVAGSSLLSPYFLTADNLSTLTSQFMEVGLIALPMTLIMITADIDLSVGSMVGLTGLLFGLLFVAGWPLILALACTLLFGALLGAMNGLIVTRLRLPSLVVTLGTLALYRGSAQILYGDGQISSYPAWFVGIDQRQFLGLPLPLVLFLLCALVFGLLLHMTTFGRLIYAIGGSKEAARFSAVAVDRVRLILFVLSGLVTAGAALVLTSRLGSSRWDLGQGFELDAITAVVLGGTDIFGGRGSILGTVCAVFIVGVLRNGMGLANYNGEVQSMVIGAVLIASILIPQLLRRLETSHLPWTWFRRKDVKVSSARSLDGKE